MPKVKAPIAPPLSEAQRVAIAEKYLAFRSNPLNDRFEDAKFCSENSVSLDNLEKIKSIEFSHKVDSVPLTEQNSHQNAEILARKINQLWMQRALPVKSLEGLTNAYTNLLKQLALLRGAPTERIEFSEVKKKTPAETHRWLMQYLRSDN